MPSWLMLPGERYRAFTNWGLERVVSDIADVLEIEYGNAALAKRLRTDRSYLFGPSFPCVDLRSYSVEEWRLLASSAEKACRRAILAARGEQAAALDATADHKLFMRAIREIRHRLHETS